MPVPKPTELPEWASGVADITDPPLAKKQAGWVVEQPAHDVFNWWQNCVFKWAQWLNDLTNQALTWAALHVFGAGIHVTGGATVDALTVTGSTTFAAPVTYPALAAGAFTTGARKLSYWTDANGCLHIEGRVASLGGGAPSILVWAAGTVPASARPTGGALTELPCVVNGTAAGVVSIASDGSLTFTSVSGAGLISAEISICINPNVAIA